MPKYDILFSYPLNPLDITNFSVNINIYLLMIIFNNMQTLKTL